MANQKWPKDCISVALVCGRRFNRTCPDQRLDLCLSRSLSEVRDTTSNRLTKCNEEWPRDALQDMAPVNWQKRRMKTLGTSGHAYGVLSGGNYRAYLALTREKFEGVM